MARRANGEGNLRFLPDKNLWKIERSFGYSPETGKKIRKCAYGKTKSEAIKKMETIALGIRTGEYVDKNSITIYILGKQMLDDDLNLNVIKECTYHRNMETLKAIKPLHDIPIQKLDEFQIKQFLLSQTNKSQSVIRKEYGMLRRILEMAMKKGIITKSPILDVKKPKSKQKQVKVRALTVQEQSKLMSILINNDVSYRYPILLSLLTGMRIGEVCALRVKDVFFDFGLISINRTLSKDGKGRAIIGETTKTYAGTRKIPITDELKSILVKCVKLAGDNELLFTKNNDGKTLIGSSMVNMVLKRLFEKYDIIDETVEGKVTCHSLRHSYATRCIESGMNYKVLSSLLGHTDIKVTLNTYTDAFDKFKNDNVDLVSQYMKSIGLSVAM